MKFVRVIFIFTVILLISHESLFAAISGAVSAPLDGGLLAILAAAGVGYYVMRKRQKSSH